jgi:hypothetical protein
VSEAAVSSFGLSLLEIAFHSLARRHQKAGCPGVGEFANSVRPYPGQLWKHDSIRVIVVAVSPNTVTYEDLSRRAGVTRDSLSNFLTGFIRLKSPAR